MCLAQLSKIICYNPGHPYLITIPTVLLSAGMLFFFTLGSSMVGDICDEDELKTGHRSEGSYYAIFWWFIKMGTALASFVAGALIVLTMFDETQVTKVDSLQGSIREIRSKVQYWQGYHGLSTSNAEWLEKTKIQSAEALEEAKDYLNYLEKESIKKLEKTNPTLPAYPGQRRNMLLNELSTTKSAVNDLKQLQSRVKNMGPQSPDYLIKAIVEEAIPLTLQIKLEKARKNSFELMSHLEDKSHKTKNSAAHYRLIMQNITGVNNRLVNLNTTLPLDFLDKEIGAIESQIVPLTKQTPYTLLMMRVVEIGLPLLLSLISIFFILRFSLTEKRCHEIKDLLRQRSMERLHEDTNKSEPTIIQPE
jgi:hypothetical protein